MRLYTPSTLLINREIYIDYVFFHWPICKFPMLNNRQNEDKNGTIHALDCLNFFINAINCPKVYQSVPQTISDCLIHCNVW